MMGPTRMVLLSIGLSCTVASRLTMQQFVRVALLKPTTLRAGGLAILCPLACTTAGFSGNDFDPSLLSLIIATPSAFTINAAYARRERALSSLAEFSAASRSIQCSLARWGRTADSERGQRELVDLFDSLCRHLESKGDETALPAIYRHLEAVGDAIELVRLHPRRDSDLEAMPALATVMCGDERKLMQSIEDLLIVASTGTPYVIRGFTVGGSTLFPIIFGPYFAAIALAPESIDDWAAYLVSFLLAATIGSLVSIQEALEDPFDGDAGIDDITLANFAPRARL